MDGPEGPHFKVPANKWTLIIVLAATIIFGGDVAAKIVGPILQVVGSYIPAT